MPHPTDAVANRGTAPPELDPLKLLRAYEPVVKLTRGETFFPVDVGPYVATAALWQSTAGGEAEIKAEPGTLTLDSLSELGSELAGPGHSLSVVSTGRPPSLRERLRMRDHREHLKGGSRLAEVGVLGRTIDSVSRLSLLFRGSVPGGSAAASLRIQDEKLHPAESTYFGRVIADGGYLICQYWFFYAFNNWRSGFGGVNEHEADWEQVTIYLDGTGELDQDGLPPPRWVVFSAHDETGDDLRRRWDDPDLTLVAGRHPVVFAGAGSHSGAYLAGDYLITVEPPNLGGAVKYARRIMRVLTPWSTGAQGVGIPYIDYARGDGRSIGPEQDHEWTPTLIDENTGWVVNYRGLWGTDTRDRLGGERGPAGPRYERDGTVRSSWADPVGWAGLSKVAPNPRQEREYLARRVVEIDEELAGLNATIATGRQELRVQTAGLAPESPEVRSLSSREEELLELRKRAVGLTDERGRLQRAEGSPPSPAGVHAHLSHRLTPIQHTSRSRRRLLGIWAVLSTPLILWMLARLVLPTGSNRTAVLIALLVTVFFVEALARGYFMAFLVRALVLVGIGVLLFYAIQYGQLVTYWTLVALAVIVLLVNLRDALRR